MNIVVIRPPAPEVITVRCAVRRRSGAKVREDVAAGADIIKVCVDGWPAMAFEHPDRVEIHADELAACSPRYRPPAAWPSPTRPAAPAAVAVGVRARPLQLRGQRHKRRDDPAAGAGRWCATTGPASRGRAGRADDTSNPGWTRVTWLWVALPAVGALLALWLVFRLDRWWTERSWKGLTGTIVLDPALEGRGESSRLYPESLFTVEISETGVTCRRPDRKIESVLWDDLERVEILNTEAGPHRPDVFWVLHGTNSGCVIPQGATGDRELLERLQKLPGFDNGAVIRAMVEAGAMRTLCWQRPTGTG